MNVNETGGGYERPWLPRRLYNSVRDGLAGDRTERRRVANALAEAGVRDPSRRVVLVAGALGAGAGLGGAAGFVGRPLVDTGVDLSALGGFLNDHTRLARHFDPEHRFDNLTTVDNGGTVTVVDEPDEETGGRRRTYGLVLSQDRGPLAQSRTPAIELSITELGEDNPSLRAEMSAHFVQPDGGNFVLANREEAIALTLASDEFLGLDGKTYTTFREVPKARPLVELVEDVIIDPLLGPIAFTTRDHSRVRRVETAALSTANRRGDRYLHVEFTGEILLDVIDDLTAYNDPHLRALWS